MTAHRINTENSGTGAKTSPATDISEITGTGVVTHGGNLRQAIAQYGGDPADWMDLSTGINPHAYPAPPIAADAWHRLPEPDARLVDAACAYYRAPVLLPVAGTQAAIQALPRLRAHSRVAIVSPTYAEHALRWREAAHAVTEISPADIDIHIDHCDVLVICNPNNPTGHRTTPDLLLAWSQRLASRNGWLVVDEAFGDMEPALSVAAHCQQPGLIVLRSVGKFFGLAGLRLGFVGAVPVVLERLAALLGPWAISGPAQQVGVAALSDDAWQRDMRARLADDGLRLRQLLAQYLPATSGTDLFQWCAAPVPTALHEHLARHHIWVRLFPNAARGLRWGLPAAKSDWARLDLSLAGFQIGA
ncbi:threonine-phosphate decarboxylase CobD [Pigmentiphaga aceris]|uniref:threonine-phosphate decarboxylase CobD n=1 Tax=Pigmentiphaga aceris TaxID=1940612 RepID=UPI001651C871